MIIGIDESNGVGKYHVTAKLEELLSERNYDYAVKNSRDAYPWLT